MIKENEGTQILLVVKLHYHTRIVNLWMKLPKLVQKAIGILSAYTQICSGTPLN